MALMLCAQELMTRPAGSWLAAYAAVLCGECGNAYPDHRGACPACHPHFISGQVADAPAVAETVSAGGWMAAYGAKVCDHGHAYVPRKGRDGCPRCRPGAGGMRAPQLPGIAGGFGR
jgi:hypothetical protein